MQITLKYEPNLLNEDHIQNHTKPTVCKDQQDQAKTNKNFISKLLFPKINIQLKGQRFINIPEIQLELQVVLDMITKWENHGCIQHWKK
jgi:hypothetical protein